MDEMAGTRRGLFTGLMGLLLFGLGVKAAGAKPALRSAVGQLNVRSLTTAVPIPSKKVMAFADGSSWEWVDDDERYSALVTAHNHVIDDAPNSILKAIQFKECDVGSYVYANDYPLPVAYWGA
jgi:hypothetical protein